MEEIPVYLFTGFMDSGKSSLISECSKDVPTIFFIFSIVLSKFKKDEQPAMDEAFENAAKAAELIVDGRIDEAMNKFSH